MDVGTVWAAFRRNETRGSLWVGRETAVRGRKTVVAKIGENGGNRRVVAARL
eukprot:COSAG02_NODE_56021_length_287_cov_1.202128_1_plen_52_part_10